MDKQQAQALIAQARKDIGVEALADLARGKFNCADADISEDGDVFIEGPQRGHWIGQSHGQGQERLIDFAEFVSAR